MNVNHLRRQLRTGGWRRHAVNLGAYLAEHGVRSERTVSGRTLRFHVDSDGRLLAYLQTRGGLVPVADEDRVLLTREDADELHKRETLGSTAHLGVRLPSDLMDRLERATGASRLNKSGVVRAAIEAYLDARGL